MAFLKRDLNEREKPRVREEILAKSKKKKKKKRGQA
jgi:hypothetical protein